MTNNLYDELLALEKLEAATAQITAYCEANPEDEESEELSVLMSCKEINSFCQFSEQVADLIGCDVMTARKMVSTKRDELKALLSKTYEMAC
jgi:hypothetical protein